MKKDYEIPFIGVKMMGFLVNVRKKAAKKAYIYEFLRVTYPYFEPKKCTEAFCTSNDLF